MFIFIKLQLLTCLHGHKKHGLLTFFNLFGLF